MAQYPIEIGDQAAISEGLNYLLSGPAGLGQNFQGFSAYLPGYIRPSTRQPWSLAITSTLDPSVYLAIPINNAVPVGGNPSQFVTFTFTTPQATAPFQYGDGLAVSGVDPDFYNDNYTVYSSTTTDVTVVTGDEYTWPAYVSGGSVGRDYLDGTSMDTDCNARVTVQGPTDQVFVSAQLNLDWEYNCSTATDYQVVVRITRLRGFPDTTPGSNDYLFKDTVIVSERTFDKSVTTGTGTQSIEAIFTTVLDGPNLDFGYYWYILTVEFVMPGSLPIDTATNDVDFSGTKPVLGSTTVYSALNPVTTTGSGSGLTVDVELLAGASVETYTTNNTTIDVTAGGSDYRVGDTLTILGTDLGGATPANDMTLVINTITGPYDTTIGRATTGLRSLTAQVVKQ
jgi:hypothetical protein